MSRRRAVSAALAATLVMLLTGCSFVNDVFEGQRITTERLGVDGVLRSLVADLAAIDGVESAVYSFDAADVSTTPSVDVELATTSFALWDAVVTRIDAAGDDAALAAYPAQVAIASPDLTSSFDTKYGADWFDDATFAVATDAASAFPGSRVRLEGVGPDVANVSVAAPESAELLLARVADDPVVRELFDSAQAGGDVLGLGADGFGLSDMPTAAETAWALDLLDTDAPRYPVVIDPSAEFVSPDEWIRVALDGSHGVYQVELISAAPLGSGPVWDAFVSILRTGAPDSRVPGECVLMYVNYAWPGASGNWPLAVPTCAPYSIEQPDRPALLELREALAAEGIIPEELGFELV
jgi:hypothetical protein